MEQSLQVWDNYSIFYFTNPLLKSLTNSSLLIYTSPNIPNVSPGFNFVLCIGIVTILLSFQSVA